MQISSVGYYNSLYSILYGTTSTTSTTSANTSTLNDLSSLLGTSTSEDQVTLSSDYEDFKSFMEKVKDGTVTDEDLASMQELLNTTDIQSMMPPPPPPPDSSEGVGMDGIGSVGADAVSGSSEESTDAQTIISFLDKVKEGTITEDDLTEMQDLLTEMEEQGIQMRPPMPPPMMGMSQTSSEDSEDESSIWESESADLQTLMSFFEKVKEGTVTEDDLTQIQNLLLNQEEESYYTGQTDDLSNA